MIGCFSFGLGWYYGILWVEGFACLGISCCVLDFVIENWFRISMKGVCLGILGVLYDVLCCCIMVGWVALGLVFGWEILHYLGCGYDWLLMRFCICLFSRFVLLGIFVVVDILCGRSCFVLVVYCVVWCFLGWQFC